MDRAFSHSIGKLPSFLGRCPRLIWNAPLALQTSESVIDSPWAKSEPFLVTKESGDAQSFGGSSRLRSSAAIGVFVLVVLAGMILLRINQLPPDPVYHGKKLSGWLQTYASTSPNGVGSPEWLQTDGAVRHIGTNAIPYLLQLLREKDSSLTLRMVALAKRQRIIKIHFIPASTRNREASMAFLALSHAAKDAVPELIKIYNEDSSPESKRAIEDVFSWIGPACEARPSIAFASSD